MNAPNKPIVFAALPPLELRTKEEIMEWLKNPQVVYQSMLRGVIAPLSMDLMANIHGEEMAVRWQAFVNAERAREEAVDLANTPPDRPYAALTASAALKVIASWPITEPANMDAMNMRAVAMRAAPVPHVEAVGTIYVGKHGSREVDDWKVPLPEGSTTLYRLTKASK